MICRLNLNTNSNTENITGLIYKPCFDLIIAYNYPSFSHETSQVIEKLSENFKQWLSLNSVIFVTCDKTLSEPQKLITKRVISKPSQFISE